ncbi:hypothetical protein DID74_02680, partial [Candidatus Marinamargulisbacteria bacterium SCGC AG-333-B06]
MDSYGQFKESGVFKYTMWPFWVLTIAGIYNIFWGVSVVFFPNLYFSEFGLSIPSYPIIWQFIGFFVMVYGVGYLIASLNPVRFWPFIFIGFLIKLFLLISFFIAVLNDYHLLNFWVFILFNSVIWLIPFLLILRLVYSLKLARENFNVPSFEEAIQIFKTNHGQSLYELSQEKKVLVVFLRHFGCVFCRQLLHIVETNYSYLRDNGVVPVLVYMADHAIAT